MMPRTSGNPTTHRLLGSAALLAVLLAPMLAVAQPPPPPPPPPAPSPPPPAPPAGTEAQINDSTSFNKGRVVLRGGVSLDLNKQINLGGKDDPDGRVGGGATAGIGYFVVDNLSLDADARALFQISPEVDMTSLGIIPGARYQVTPQIGLRAGVPIEIEPETGVGVLGGLAYHQPIGAKARLVVGIDYTYYFTEYYRQVAPKGRVDITGGVQTSF